MRIRYIEKSDNKKIAATIRKVIIEMGAPKTGTTYEDEELDAMFEAYEKERFIYFVIENGKQIFGGAGIAPLKNGDPLICELQKMYFLPEARGKGFGNQMIQRCIDFAKVSNFKQCYIETMPNMQDAQKLYTKTGFKYIDHSLGNTGHSSCSIWMLKTL